VSEPEIEKTFEVYEAFLRNGRVEFPSASKLMEIRERGFGELKGRKLVLAPYESFYLLEKGRITVENHAGEKTNFEQLVKAISGGRPEVWVKYLVYRDLRDRGYIVRECSGFDFEIHGKGPMRRFIWIVYEGGEANLKTLRQLLTRTAREKKELILAVVDRRTDIVYYTLDFLKVHPAFKSTLASRQRGKT
jgi:tRNA-intron endonuclease